MKSRVYISLEDNCLGWHLITRTGSSYFGASLSIDKQGRRWLSNFLWTIPALPTLKELLPLIADKSFDEMLRRWTKRFCQGPAPRRRDVEHIRIKPDMEERYRAIMAKLKPDNTEPVIHTTICNVEGVKKLQFGP